MGQLAINILIKTLIYLLIVVSFKQLYATSKFFVISHAISITFGAYFTYFFSITIQLSLLFSIPFAIILVTLIALMNEIVVYKPLRKKNIHNWQFLIASLGIYIILQNIISLFYGDETKSFRTWRIKEGYQFLGGNITNVQLITVIVILGILILHWFFMKKISAFQKIKAVSSNSDLSEIFGISKDKTILLSFTLGSSLASIAGILIAADTDMRPTMGFDWLLYGVVAMIIGGVGKPWGLLAGSLLLALSQHFIAYFIGSQWMDAIAYVILIIFLLLRPYGFGGRQLKKVEI
jgi:branched-chain amino acid transport system permease protein